MADPELEEGEVFAADGDQKMEGSPVKEPGPLCEVCGEKERLYCCPRCAIKTCSLTCCKAHKKQSGCSGRRERIEFCELRDFTDEQLKKDYFFLEEVINSAQAAKRKLGAVKGAGLLDQSGGRKRRRGEGAGGEEGQGVGRRAERALGLAPDWLDRHPPALQRLVKHVRSQGITLLLMPPGMGKRKRNSSKCGANGNKVYWRIEWAFPDASLPVKLFENSFDEDRPILQALDAYLEPHEGNGGVRQRLLPYHSDPSIRKDLRVLLECVPTHAHRPAYWSIDPTSTLRQELQGKVLVEFPVLHVVLPCHAHKYPQWVTPLDNADSSSSSSEEEEEEEGEEEGEEEEE